MEHELRRRGVFAVGQKLRLKRGDTAYADADLIWRELLRRHPSLKSSEQAAVGKLLGRVLADWLTNRANPIPVTARAMLMNLPNTLVALDRAFPGYLNAGLLPWCWKNYG